VEHAWQIAIDAVVSELLQELDCSEPPVDAVDSLKRLGMEVALDSSQTSRGRQKSLAGRKAVFLKPDPRPERFQWSAAHELGEICAWRIFDRLDAFDFEPTPRLREQIANQFASRFLLPERWFRRDALSLENHLFELKSRYATASHELIARRLLDYEPQKILTIIDGSQITTRIGTTGDRIQEMIPAEKVCWEEVRVTGLPRRIEVDSLAIDVWPIHEADWKREIVLTSLIREFEEAAFE
jgi:hypothetical protein